MDVREIDHVTVIEMKEVGTAWSTAYKGPRRDIRKSNKSPTPVCKSEKGPINSDQSMVTPRGLPTHADGEAVIMLAFQASGRGSTPLQRIFFMFL